MALTDPLWWARVPTLVVPPVCIQPMFLAHGLPFFALRGAAVEFYRRLRPAVQGLPTLCQLLDLSGPRFPECISYAR